MSVSSILPNVLEPLPLEMVPLEPLLDPDEGLPLLELPEVLLLDVPDPLLPLEEEEEALLNAVPHPLLEPAPELLDELPPAPLDELPLDMVLDVLPEPLPEAV